MRRHNRLAERGVLVLDFSPAQVRREPATVLATVEQAYRERARAIAGFTAVRALPASWG